MILNKHKSIHFGRDNCVNVLVPKKNVGTKNGLVPANALVPKQIGTNKLFGNKKVIEEPTPPKSESVDYKYHEDRVLKELKEYVDKTYGEHYSQNKYQATEFIIDSGHGTGFCLGNILKYAQRYGKKGSREDARKDLLKVLHYGMIALYVHDKEK